MAVVEEEQHGNAQSRPVDVQLDEGNTKVKTRSSWWKIW